MTENESTDFQSKKSHEALMRRQRSHLGVVGVIKIKSGKQKRTELRNLKALKRQELLAVLEKKRNSPPNGAILVRPDFLATDGSWGSPDFVNRGFYLDVEFTCQGCGKAETWTAAQQKWWYEIAKGYVWTTARFCRQCRRNERERKTEARRVQLEGMARKKERMQKFLMS